MTTAVVVLCLYLVWMVGAVMSALAGRWLRSLAPESTALAVVALVIFVAGLCWPFVVLGCRVRRAGTWRSRMLGRRLRASGRTG